MLSTLPGILFLAPFSALLIRIALSAVFAHAAWMHYGTSETSARALAVAEAAIGGLILIGAWTQIAAIAGACIIAGWLIAQKLRPLPQSTTLLALVMCASLLVTGAGALAFDLPL